MEREKKLDGFGEKGKSTALVVFNREGPFFSI
jgi:hypothetical protein